MKFIVIDLYSQREHVQKIVADWSVEKIIQWLETFGEVQYPYGNYVHGYHIFTSQSGLKTYFQFDDDYKLIVSNSGWLY